MKYFASILMFVGLIMPTSQASAVTPAEIAQHIASIQTEISLLQQIINEYQYFQATGQVAGASTLSGLVIVANGKTQHVDPAMTDPEEAMTICESYIPTSKSLECELMGGSLYSTNNI